MAFNLIPFPVDKLKAETLRSMAKDLNVSPGGKKEDLLERLRKNSDSGWTTPSKRKGDDEPSEAPSADRKKPKTLKSLKQADTFSTPVRSSRRRAAIAAPPVETPQLPNSNRGRVEVHKESTSEPPASDEHFASGVTSVFLTADSLINLVDSQPVPGNQPNSKAISLWKPSAAFEHPDRKAEERFHHWLVVDEEGSVQNVTAFREEHEKILEQEKSRRDAQLMTKASEIAVDGKNVKEDKEDVTEGTAEVTEGTEDVTEKAVTKTWWYEILLSRRMSKGALAVKLVRDVTHGVSLRNAVDEDVGTFWLSGLKPASQENAEMLDEMV